jgi:hypothetical protein
VPPIATARTATRGAFEYEHERRGAVSQHADRAEPDAVEHDEHDGLQRDAAQDVPDRDAEVVRQCSARRVAISGRLVASDRITCPPMPSRWSSASVVFEKWMPAIQTAPAAPRNMSTRSASDMLL